MSGSKANIEVRVGGRGVVRGGEKMVDPATKAICELCGTETDVVVSVTPSGGAPFGCKGCLRARLEAITVAVYELRGDEPGAGGLPWGKVSG
jgi:N-acetylmuramic acid 6-phosphate (MurNAc-6-P) etherase